MPLLDQAQCVRDYSSTTQTTEVASNVVHMDPAKNFAIELFILFKESINLGVWRSYFLHRQV